MEEIALVRIPPQQVLGITTTGTYALIPMLIAEIYDYIAREGIAIAGPPLFICHETSFEAVQKANQEGSARLEVAWPVSGIMSGTGWIRGYSLPGGEMVRTLHHGPYETCGTTYQGIFSWIAARRLSITGPIREIYPNNPCEARPEEILTEILVPVS